MKFFTPEQYVLARVLQYPTLYSSSSYESTAFNVFDQLFNVIANGIRDHEELINELEFKSLDENEAKRYITEEKLFYGYSEVENIGDLVFPKINSSSINALDSDREKYSQILLWRESKKHNHRDPYSNFNKEYSIIYKSDFLEFGEELIDAAKWFYGQCKEYFNGDCRNFSNAFLQATDKKRPMLLNNTNNRLPNTLLMKKYLMPVA